MSEPVIYVPSLTRQYSDDGNLSSSNEEMPFGEDVRERFRAAIIATWDGTRWGGIQSWDRLCALIAAQLDKLPDNPFVIKNAWLCGLITDGGPYVAGYFAALDKYRAELAEKQRIEAAREAKWADLRSKVSCSVVRRFLAPSEPGQRDPAVVVAITPSGGGETLRFVCRNVFDVGYVINPDYPISPGRDKGGICNVEQGQWYWMDYVPSNGWERIRNLTPFERLAMDYLYEFPPVLDEVRL